MSTQQTFPPTEAFARNVLITKETYDRMYAESVRAPESFWAKQAERLHWFKKWDAVKKTSFQKPVSIGWFLGGKLNVAYNCLDRHLPAHKDRVAFHWEADAENAPSRKVTYGELHEDVCRMANVLRKYGVGKGDRVTIYMPMIPEAAAAMLACARIGAIHSVVFGGFSPDSISDRINDCESSFVITADEGRRAGKVIPLKANVDTALKKTTTVKNVLVVATAGGPGTSVNFETGRDLWWHEERGTVSAECEAVPMDAEDPLFILYTSGSTGKPKGVLHTTGGYLLYAAMTHEYVFDHRLDDVYMCTADIGWVTGHSYMVYGPLANLATSVMFEGVPNYPDHGRLWRIVDKYKISIFYTAPTALRALMREGDSWVTKTSRKSLRVLGTVGEPINPEAWLWYHRVVGEGRCPIVDTWWQTETGGMMITSLPGATTLKPGSATKPFFGVRPKLLTSEGAEITGAGEGILVIEDSWPGQMRTVYRDHARFEETYFSAYKGYYFTGDGCRRDEDGDYWITGRVDDVLNVSGHRLGTAEVESALVAHPQVAEAAVVGYPHDVKGQGIYAYVTLNTGVTPSDELKKELIKFVAQEISPIAKPDLLQWAPGLPKTRSGKIMRRILRKIAENAPDQLGDTSTLADPSVVTSLVNDRQNR
ncbi:MAG: acetate--CoA ligase [Bdellovibrionaceae bacterium]|nr:acetate--CoA ligase [Pseudobdellovibrionaceae bacterium]